MEFFATELLNQGVDWLHEGRAEFRFRRPTYDREPVTYSIDAGDRSATVIGSDQVVHCIGRLDLDDDVPQIPTGVPAKPTHEPLGDPSQVGVLMRSERMLDSSRSDEDAAATGFPREAGGRKQVPLNRWINANGLTRSYFDFPAAMYLSSRMWHHSPLYDGELLVTRGVITDFYERNGNGLVRMQAFLETGDGRPLVTVEQENVYRFSPEGVAARTKANVT